MERPRRRETASRLRELARAHQDERLEELADWLESATVDPLRHSSRGEVKESVLFLDETPVEDQPPSPTVIPWEGTRANGSLPPRPAAEALPDLRLRPGAEERYVELTEIARGGMGVVIEAFDRDFRRRVAMKQLYLAGAKRTAVEQFLHEAQVTAQLEHPGVVPTYDIGLREAEGERLAFYTMKRVRGRPLEKLIVQHHETPPHRREEVDRSRRRLLRILMSVCLAVEYAHQRGVIHRDLKPANVMVGDFGEVHVVDWGIATVLDSTHDIVRTVLTEAGMHTRIGAIAGTPGFMAPELRHKAEVDARADVYGLGGVLYCILCDAVPFEGVALAAILEAAAKAPPVVRHRRAGWEIPPRLEEICLRAMAPDPATRIASARALHDELEAYLDNIEETERMYAQADNLVDAGLRSAASYLGLQQEAARLDGDAADLLRRLGESAATAAKGSAWRMQDQAGKVRLAALDAFSMAERSLHKALEFAPRHAAARRTLADLYRDRYTLAEETSAGRPEDVRYYRGLVEGLDDGRHGRELSGDGTLRVATDPPGAEVHLYRFEERDRRLVPVPWRALAGWEPPGGAAGLLSSSGAGLSPETGDPTAWLGNAPVFRVGVPAGSYLVLARMPGHPLVRYPVVVGRNRDVQVSIRLYRAEDVGEGFRYVPGGPFVRGGDPLAPAGWSRGVVDVPDFFIATFPVTGLEYLEFLNDIGHADAAEAHRHAPRSDDQARLLWFETAPGKWRLPRLPRDPPGRHPVVGVTWNDAMAYCAWRSKRDGRVYQLPREVQWEKAARGADGRHFPWGDHFEAAWCNMAASREDGRQRRGPVGEFAGDESVYGVRDLAGNVLDWCGDTYRPGMDWMTLRGGAYMYEESFCRTAHRVGFAPNGQSELAGFRLVVVPAFR